VVWAASSRFNHSLYVSRPANQEAARLCPPANTVVLKPPGAGRPLSGAAASPELIDGHPAAGRSGNVRAGWGREVGQVARQAHPGRRHDGRLIGSVPDRPRPVMKAWPPRPLKARAARTRRQERANCLPRTPISRARVGPRWSTAMNFTWVRAEAVARPARGPSSTRRSTTRYSRRAKGPSVPALQARRFRPIRPTTMGPRSSARLQYDPGAEIHSRAGKEKTAHGPSSPVGGPAERSPSSPRGGLFIGADDLRRRHDGIMRHRQGGDFSGPVALGLQNGADEAQDAGRKVNQVE